MKVCVVGLGQVGVPLAIAARRAGHHVVGIDSDPVRVAEMRMQYGGAPLHADRSSQQLGTFVVSTEYTAAEGFDVAVLCVPTPWGTGVPDLSMVKEATASVASHVRPGATVVLESTTYPTTTESVVRPILEEATGLIAGVDFYLGYSSERIDPGNQDWTIVNTPKVVAGFGEASLRAVVAFYTEIVEAPLVEMESCTTAELSKLVENSFRAIGIAFVDELLMLGRRAGLDVAGALDAAATKPFGYLPFRPGAGAGGHCIPVDPLYLSWFVRDAVGEGLGMVDVAMGVLEGMPAYVVQRAEATVGRPLRGARILVLGLAYKRDTSDVRNSPGVMVAEAIMRKGGTVLAVDSWVNPQVVPCLEVVDDVPWQDLEAYEVAIVTADHSAIDYERLARSGILVLDTCWRVPRTGHVEWL